tara:strand:+ start:28 stop:513 length:486 start_codon:yes stop_codon:yes gene_type:complete
MPTVYHNQDNILEVGEDWLSLLKQEAAQAERSRARLCLHMSESDSIQEMLIVFCQDAQIKPHRTLNKPESLSVVEGGLRVVMFHDDGTVDRTFEMGAPGSGRVFMTRFSIGPWYTYVPLTEFVVIHEITRGPFDPADSAYPDWAPDEGPELQAFLDRVSAA